MLWWLPLFASGVDALRLAVVGDAGEPTATQRRVLAAVSASRPDVVVTTGDNAYEDGMASADDEARIWGSFRPDWGVPGNHDHRADPTAPSFVPARHYVRWLSPDVQLVGIDTTPLLFPERGYWNPRGLSPRWKWIERALRAPKPRWRVVVGHHPVHSATKHCDEGREAKARLDALMRGRVDVYLAGHTHCFEECDLDQGLRYVTVGSSARLNDVHTVCPREQPHCRARHETGWAMLTLTNEAVDVVWHHV